MFSTGTELPAGYKRKPSTYFAIPNGRIKNSAHQTIPGVIKSRTGAEYILKEYTSPNALPEIEAAISEIVRLLMGINQPKCRAVFDINTSKNGGVVSKVIAGFIPATFHDFGLLGSKQFKGLAALFVTQLFIANNDCHGGNWGVNDTGEIMAIDFDRALWPITCRYFTKHNDDAGSVPIVPNESYVQPFSARDNESHRIVGSYIGTDGLRYNLLECPRPNEAFNITARDLQSLPYLSDARPFHWPTLSSVDVDWNVVRFSPKFVRYKYQYLLKALYITPNIIQSILIAHITSPSVRDTIFQYLTARIQQLKTELMKIPEFHTYAANSDVLEEIRQQFIEYNEEFEKESKAGKYRTRCIDLTAVQQLGGLTVTSDSGSIASNSCEISMAGLEQVYYGGVGVSAPASNAVLSHDAQQHSVAAVEMMCSDDVSSEGRATTENLGDKFRFTIENLLQINDGFIVNQTDAGLQLTLKLNKPAAKRVKELIDVWQQNQKISYVFNTGVRFAFTTYDIKILDASFLRSRVSSPAQLGQLLQTPLAVV